MEQSLVESLEGMRAIRRDIAEARDPMTKRQEVQNQHSDAIMEIESGGSGVKVKEEEPEENEDEETQANESKIIGGRQDSMAGKGMLPMIELLHRVLDLAGDVSDKQSNVLEACTRALSKFEHTAKGDEQRGVVRQS